MTTTATDRVVYTATARPTYQRKPKRKGDGRFAARTWRGVDGRTYTFLNALYPRDAMGQPIAPLSASECIRCAYGYSHIVTERRDVCHECHTEEIAEKAMYWQRMLGIDLGWRNPDDYLPLMKGDTGRLTKQDRYGMHSIGGKRCE